MCLHYRQSTSYCFLCGRSCQCIQQNSAAPGKNLPEKFLSRYNISKLVYYEFFDSIVDAIAREKQIKKYSRVKKVELVNKKNPKWKDLVDEVEYL